MLGSWQVDIALRVAVVAIPVAVYFLILGLLNSGRRPQMLSERLDFAVLVAAIAPLWIAPLLRWLAAGPLVTLAATVGITAVLAWAATRQRHGWVIYNIDAAAALQIIAQALSSADLEHRRRDDGFTLTDGPTMKVLPFPLLRNVSISIEDPAGARRADLKRFEAELARRLGRKEVQASPAAVTFVLISTAMIVAPMVLLADRMPEMVRLLTDLVK
ncbi:MAG: hypothetical protein ACOC95_02435 [Planctomycetota bacterium]